MKFEKRVAHKRIQILPILKLIFKFKSHWDQFNVKTLNFLHSNPEKEYVKNHLNRKFSFFIKKIACKRVLIRYRQTVTIFLVQCPKKHLGHKSVCVCVHKWISICVSTPFSYQVFTLTMCTADSVLKCFFQMRKTRWIFWGFRLWLHRFHRSVTSIIFSKWLRNTWSIFYHLICQCSNSNSSEVQVWLVLTKTLPSTFSHVAINLVW